LADLVIAELARSVTRARKTLFIQLNQRDFTSPALFEKIFLFSPDPNHRHIYAVSPHIEGRIMIVTNAGWDAVDAAASGA
jgi:hypothetical protein